MAGLYIEEKLLRGSNTLLEGKQRSGTLKRKDIYLAFLIIYYSFCFLDPLRRLPSSKVFFPHVTVSLQKAH